MHVPTSRIKSVSAHQFSMIPRADIPRSSFRMQNAHKTTFSAGNIIPVWLQEVLPGDSFNLKMTAFTRMATAIYPVMDNLYLESFFFFVPNRLIWTNWVKFMGEQDNPGDSISFTIPVLSASAAGGYTRLSIHDYFGLPCAPNFGANTVTGINALPFRAYNKIFNDWFRDENLVNQVSTSTGDGPDTYNNYGIHKRGKRHDYFTSALPFAQKGTSVPLPLTGNATVKTQASNLFTGAQNALQVLNVSGAAFGTTQTMGISSASQAGVVANTPTIGALFYPANLYADLSTVTATTINALRLAFQTQKLLERDARGGTRYTEIVRSHFGVISPDARLQRSEYLGGGHSPVNITPIAQQTQTGLTGGTTPLGTLGGIGTNLARNHGFSRAFTEHGYILGLVNVRADLAYQQGIRKLWSRSTRYDFYWPVFSHLGEQAILNKEIYADGSVNDAAAFGYQERWAEYRYFPSMITGFFNSTNPTPLDAWHLAQKFTALPTLNSTFITDAADTQVQRVVAAGAAAANQQFLADIFFDVNAARPMPMYSVPGMIDHF